MHCSKQKKGILTKYDFHYHEVRMIYYNVDRKKVFSEEWVDDNNEAILAKELAIKNSNWKFKWSSKKISHQLQSEIIDEITK